MNVKLKTLEERLQVINEDTGEILWEGTSEYDANNILKHYRPNTHGSRVNDGFSVAQKLKDLFGG